VRIRRFTYSHTLLLITPLAAVLTGFAAYFAQIAHRQVLQQRRCTQPDLSDLVANGVEAG